MSIQKSLIRSKNRMRCYLNLIFPELEVEVKNIGSPTLLNFLKEYPTPSSILLQSKESFVSQKIRCMREKKLTRVYSLAEKSIGLTTHDEGAFIIKELVDDLECFIKKEKVWFQKCHESVCDLEGYERLNKIKGLGEKTVTGLLICYADYHKFKNAKQITKLAGMNLKERKSGTSIRGISKIEKRGNHSLRYWAYQAAIQVIKHDGPFKKLYERKKKNSPGRGSGKRALIAVGDKLIRVTWTMLKKGTEYQLRFDDEVRKNYK